MNPVIDQFDHVLAFFLEARHEIIRPILEKDDKAECEEHKQHEPKETADQAHAAHVNLRAFNGQRLAKFSIRHRTPLMLR